MMKTFDAGDLCLYCYKDTAPGSGKWVDRVSANRDMKDVVEELAELPTPELLKSVDPELYEFIEGYMCADCQECEQSLTCFHEDCIAKRGEKANE